MEITDFSSSISDSGLVYLIEAYRSRFSDSGKTYSVKIGCATQPSRIPNSLKECDLQGEPFGRVIAIAYFLSSHKKAEFDIHQAFDEYRLPAKAHQKRCNRKEMFCFPINEEFVGLWLGHVKAIGGKPWIFATEFAHLDESIPPSIKIASTNAIQIKAVKQTTFERNNATTLHYQPNSVTTPKPIERGSESMPSFKPSIAKPGPQIERSYQQPLKIVMPISTTKAKTPLV